MAVGKSPTPVTCRMTHSVDLNVHQTWKVCDPRKMVRSAQDDCTLTNKCSFLSCPGGDIKEAILERENDWMSVNTANDDHNSSESNRAWISSQNGSVR